MESMTEKEKKWYAAKSDAEKVQLLKDELVELREGFVKTFGGQPTWLHLQGLTQQEQSEFMFLLMSKISANVNYMIFSLQNVAAALDNHQAHLDAISRDIRGGVKTVSEFN